MYEKIYKMFENIWLSNQLYSINRINKIHDKSKFEWQLLLHIIKFTNFSYHKPHFHNIS